MGDDSGLRQFGPATCGRRRPTLGREGEKEGGDEDGGG